MHNTLRRDTCKALSALFGVAMLMSAFIVAPVPTQAQIILGVQAPATPGGDPRQPYGPTNLRATVSGRNVLLYWNFGSFSTNAVNAPQQAIVYRSENGNNFIPVKYLPVVALYTDTGPFQEGKTYYYKVVFSRSVPSRIPGAPPGDLESPSSNVVSVTIPRLPPEQKVILNANASPEYVELTWNPIFNAVGYSVLRLADRGFAKIVEEIRSTGYIDYNIQPGIQYSYRILPRTVTGQGTLSDIVDVKVPLPASTNNPTALTALNSAQRPPRNPSELSARLIVQSGERFYSTITQYEVSGASDYFRLSNSKTVNVSTARIPDLNYYRATGIELNWKPSPDSVDYYTILRSSAFYGDNDLTYYTVENVSSTVTNFIDHPPTPTFIGEGGLAWRYKVVAVKQQDRSNALSIPLYYTPYVKIFFPTADNVTSFTLEPAPDLVNAGSEQNRIGYRLANRGETVRIPYTYTNRSQYGQKVTVTEDVEAQGKDLTLKQVLIPGKVGLQTVHYSTKNLTSPSSGSAIIRPGETVQLQFEYFVSPLAPKEVHDIDLIARIELVDEVKESPSVPNLPTKPFTVTSRLKYPVFNVN